MENWIADELKKIDRDTAEIIYSDHLICDKNPQPREFEYIEKTVRTGKPVPQKSTEPLKKICLKKYFEDTNKTYFVIIVITQNHLRVVTRVYKHGKY